MAILLGDWPAERRQEIHSAPMAAGKVETDL
jgi:hypothetical protein